MSTKIYGTSLEKSTLTERVGDIGQICDARRMTYSEGRMAGVQAIEVTTGSGLAFSVLPSRGLDIAHASYRGMPLSWLSATGVGSPSFYDSEGSEWLRNFFGGLLTTCGLTYSGAPCEDEGEQLGLHGRVTNTPASEVNVVKKWGTEEYTIEISGNIRETSVFGHNLVLHRTISTALGAKKLLITDTIENAGFKESPLMMLYHVNVGWPVLSEYSRLIARSKEVTPADERAATEMDRWGEFLPPQEDYSERCYHHNLTPDNEDMVHIALVNERLGIGIYQQFRKLEFPYFTEWKMNGKGEYVVGLEPGNMSDNRAQMRRDGTLEFLEPGTERSFSLEIGVLDGIDEIESFEKEHGN